MGYARKDVEKTKKIAKKFVTLSGRCGTFTALD